MSHPFQTRAARVLSAIQSGEPGGVRAHEALSLLAEITAGLAARAPIPSADLRVTTADAPSDDDVLSPEQLSVMIKRSKSTLAKWRMRGIGPPHVKIGPKMVGYRLGAVRAYVAQQERLTTIERM